MFEKHCPRCRSTRLQLGYKESSLRLIGIGELLCNNCNLEFKSFTLFGSLRREQSTREETTRNRRRAPRFKVRLPVRVAQIISYSDGGEARLSAALSGEARDLSKLGLAIILPASGVGGSDFTDLSKRLSIHLTLPDGVVTMGVTAVRYEKLDGKKSKATWLLGVHIRKMSESDRELYYRFVDELEQGASSAQQPARVA